MSSPQAARPEDPDSIRRMFEGLAPVYDRLNTVFTFGLDRAWRRAAALATGAGPGERVLDVCTGTGRTLTELDRLVAPGGVAVGIDFAPAMLRLAVGRTVLGDALALPFADAAFDGAVMTFGLRDVADQRRAVGEMVRVTRRGGGVVILEVGRPRRQPARTGFDLWFRGAVPLLGAVAGQGGPFRFLARSTRWLPAPGHLVTMLEEAGLGDVTWRELTLGAVWLFAGVVKGNVLPRRATG